MKDAIKGLIKNDRLNEYIKNGKRDREESPIGKSISKTADVGTSGESNEASKVKRLYIAVKTRGAPRATLPSKGTIKRKISEMMAAYVKEASTSTKVPGGPC